MIVVRRFDYCLRVWTVAEDFNLRVNLGRVGLNICLIDAKVVNLICGLDVACSNIGVAAIVVGGVGAGVTCSLNVGGDGS